MYKLNRCNTLWRAHYGICRPQRTALRSYPRPFSAADDTVFRAKERAEESIWIATMEKEIREEERMKARRAAKASAAAAARDRIVHGESGLPRTLKVKEEHKLDTDGKSV